MGGCTGWWTITVPMPWAAACRPSSTAVATSGTPSRYGVTGIATTSRSASAAVDRSASAIAGLLDLPQRPLFERADVLQHQAGRLVGVAGQRGVEDLPVLAGLLLPGGALGPHVHRDQGGLFAQVVEHLDQDVVVAVEVEGPVE